jgi:hypothetical protein
LFDVFVSVDGGPLELWLDDTDVTTAPYTGTVGHTYGFAVAVTDAVGHDGPSPASVQASTLVVEDAGGPTTQPPGSGGGNGGGGDDGTDGDTNGTGDTTTRGDGLARTGGDLSLVWQGVLLIVAGSVLLALRRRVQQQPPG